MGKCRQHLIHHQAQLEKTVRLGGFLLDLLQFMCLKSQSTEDFMRIWLIGFLCLSLASCNSIYYKPGTLDTRETIYTHRGGYSMARSIKETMEKRGYHLSVGKLKYIAEVSGKDIFQIPKDVKYAVNVEERTEKLRPIWCMFNGFWWWSFNVSVINRYTN